MQTVRSRTSLVACAIAVVAPVACAGDLDARVDALLEGTAFTERLQLSVCVIDGETSELLAEHHPDRRLIPASNMKLFTSGAALHLLGPEFDFVTELVLFEGALPDGSDRLVVRGTGDPAFADPELLDDMGTPVETFIAHWVDAIEQAGAGDSVGEIVLDARIFDDQLVHPSWPVDQLNRWYCAEVSGINFHANVLKLYTKPNEIGRPPIITVEPETPWISVRNRARTVGKDKRHTAWASRSHGVGDGENRIEVHADVRHASTPIEVAIHRPELILGRVIATRLAERGYEEPLVRLARADEVLSDGTTIHRVRSPLHVVLERCNTDSHNLYAEALLKRVGAEASHAQGSWSRGSFALRSLLASALGPSASESVTVADGSGMSRDNRVTTRSIAGWLRTMLQEEDLRDAFVESLPSAGAEGTLRKRFRARAPEHTVVAKTGYLKGVSALSGYVMDEHGRTLIFSIISNEKPSDVPLRSVRKLEERLVLLLDEHMTELAESAER